MTDNEDASAEPYNAWVLHSDAPLLHEACPSCKAYTCYPYVLQEFTLEGVRPRYIRVGCSTCQEWSSLAMEIDYPS